MGRGWQADWVTAKIFFSNLRTHEMNKCWKFQADILIHVWFRAKRLKICCNQWTPKVQIRPWCTLGVHWLQQIFSLLALNQTWIKISAWNFSICSSHVCANLRKNFWPFLNQPASHGPFRPKLWMPLATIFVEIFQKGKKWWGSWPIGVTSWKDFKNGVLKFFERAVGPPSRCPWLVPSNCVP